MEIPSVLISDGDVRNYNSVQELLLSGAEEIMAVDLDAFTKNRLNLKVYEHLAKYFDVIVLNFPTRISDMIDTIISGASAVVIPDYLPLKRLPEFMEYSSDLIMNYKMSETVIQFSKLGGTRYLSRREVPFAVTAVYYIGAFPPSGPYIKLKDFPEDAMAQYI
ncbi:MAG: hypothetical protein ACP5NK_04195 [Thermoplasmata archaeon]